MTIPVKNEPNDVKHLGNTVQTSDMSKIIAEAVAEALKAAIPAAAVGIAQAQNQAGENNRAALVREMVKRTKRCPICGQPETACGGAFAKDKKGEDIVETAADGSIQYNPKLNHVMAYVGPKDDNLFKWFQGVRVNGIRYLADAPGRRQWIPIKSDILSIVNAWEQNEKELSQKRTAEGFGAGAVGTSGQAIAGNQNFLGWR